MGRPNCTGGKMSIIPSHGGQPNSTRPATRISAIHPKVTTSTIFEKKQRREPITCLPGYDNTLPVTMDEMLHHTRAVRRAVRSALLIADMPFGAYHTDEKEGVHNAVRFIKEAGAEAVKLERGAQRVSLVRRVLDAEVPVMGHIGLTPQSLHK